MDEFTKNVGDPRIISQPAQDVNSTSSARPFVADSQNQVSLTCSLHLGPHTQIGRKAAAVLKKYPQTETR